MKRFFRARQVAKVGKAQGQAVLWRSGMDVRVDRRKSRLFALQQTLAHLVSGFAIIFQFKVRQAQREMERRGKAADLRERRTQHADDFLVLADFVKVTGELGQQHFAQFWHHVGGRLRRHEFERGAIFFNAAGQIAGADEFKTEVHGEVGVAGIFFDGEAQQAQVAFDFVAILHHLLRVAVMQKLRGAKAGGQSPRFAQSNQAGENLLVDAAMIENSRRVAEQARHKALAVRFLTVIHQRQPETNRVGLPDVRQQALVLRGGQFFVGVEHQDPIAGRVFQRHVAGGAEIIGPGEGVNFRAERFRNFGGAIRGAGVHDDDLAGQTEDGLEAGPEKFPLVPGDEADRELSVRLLRQFQPLRIRC